VFRLFDAGRGRLRVDAGVRRCVEDDPLPPVLIARADVGVARFQLGGPQDVLRGGVSVGENALRRVDVPVLVLVPARRPDTGAARDVLIAAVARGIGFERSDDLWWVVA